MYTIREISSHSSKSSDDIIQDGALIWGDATSPDDIIQSSFIEEMSVVSDEVRTLLDSLKLREKDVRGREMVLDKRQLRMDLKEKEIKGLQSKVQSEFEKLEQGTLKTVVTLENSILELKKENQRLKASFQSMSKNHNDMKTELELVQSKNAKLEKQLASANGRIKNLLKLQDRKTKELSENKENIKSPEPSKLKPKKPKPTTPKPDHSSFELSGMLMKVLSNIDQEHFTDLFEDTFQHQITGLLSSLTSYLRQVAPTSAVIQYPCLKLLLKCVSVMNETEVNMPSVKVIFRKISEVLCTENHYSFSPHLHCRLVSCLTLSKTSLQVQALNRVLKQITLDVQEEGAPDIMINSDGHKVLLSGLEDPLKQRAILHSLIILTTNPPSTSDPITSGITSHLPQIIELLEEGDTEMVISVSILLQRLSVLGPVRARLRQAAPLFRRMINENCNSNSLVVLNFKAVLMNIDCERQIPNL